MSRRTWRSAACAGSVFLVLVFRPAAILHAAEAPTFDWNAGLQTVAALESAGAGLAVDSHDALSLDLGLAHHVGPGVMSYQLGGQLAYEPQQVPSGAPVISALAVYPTESGVTYALTPAQRGGAWLRASAGRVALEEPTGLLLLNPAVIFPKQLADGLLFETRRGGFYASLGAGYLGLLDKRLNRVRPATRDDAELADLSVSFAPPRGLAVVRLEAAELVLGQDCALFGVGQKDFRTGSSTVDSWYIGAAVRGSIVPALRQESEVVTAFTVPSGAPVGFGVLVRELVAWKVPVRLMDEAWCSVLWASSLGGSLEAFPALAGPPASDAYAVPLSDLVRVELGADALFPFAPAGAELRLGFAARLILRPSGVQAPGYSFTLAGPYVGTELQLSAGLEPIEGVRVTARGGAMLAPSTVLPYARLEAALTL